MRQAVRVGRQILLPRIRSQGIWCTLGAPQPPTECFAVAAVWEAAAWLQQIADFPGKRLYPCDRGFGIYFLRGIASDASASAYAVTAITAAFLFNCCTLTLSRVSAAE